MTDRITFDGPVILGAGLAGLTAALARPRKALVLSPTPLATGCSSAWAQGGMAAALSDEDAPPCTPPTPSRPARACAIRQAVELLTTEGPPPSAPWPPSARPSTARPTASSC
jgi:L-aspartate oxidase